MSRKKRKFCFPLLHPSKDGEIPQPTIPRESELVFSFKYLDMSAEPFHLEKVDKEYHKKMLSRLREMCRMSAGQAQHERSLRFHEIDWDKASKSGFGITGGEDFDKVAFQFAISANKYGRVHGFLSENVFFVRWFDPDHRLSP